MSQIDGNPAEKDGKGRISKLGLDGTVVTADWVTGLNAPKGLRSFGGTLWVSDIDEVIGIDIASERFRRASRSTAPSFSMTWRRGPTAPSTCRT